MERQQRHRKQQKVEETRGEDESVRVSVERVRQRSEEIRGRWMVLREEVRVGALSAPDQPGGVQVHDLVVVVPGDRRVHEEESGGGHDQRRNEPGAEHQRRR